MIYTLLLPLAVVFEAAAAVAVLADAPPALSVTLVLLGIASTALAWWLRLPREWAIPDNAQQTPTAQAAAAPEPEPVVESLEPRHLALLDSAQQTAAAQFTLIHGEFEQLRGILGDATNNLSTSLTGVDEAADGQREHLKQLIESLLATAAEGAHEEQTHGIHRFARQSDAIVTRLVNSLSELSQSGLRAGDAFTAVLERVEDILQHTREVDAINEQINLLATHTAIDSVRASDEGRQLARIAMDVRSLAERTRRFSTELSMVIEDARAHAREVNIEVGRLRGLDLSVAEEARDEVRRMGELMQSLNDRAVNQYERVTNITQRIREHVFSGVMSLQFEDLMRQLMEHVEARVRNLELYTIDVIGLQRRAHQGDTNDAELLDELEHVLITARERFETLNHKAVEQTDLNEGDAEMF